MCLKTQKQQIIQTILCRNWFDFELSTVLSKTFKLLSIWLWYSVFLSLVCLTKILTLSAIIVLQLESQPHFFRSVIKIRTGYSTTMTIMSLRKICKCGNITIGCIPEGFNQIVFILSEYKVSYVQLGMGTELFVVIPQHTKTPFRWSTAEPACTSKWIIVQTIHVTLHVPFSSLWSEICIQNSYAVHLTYHAYILTAYINAVTFDKIL